MNPLLAFDGLEKHYGPTLALGLVTLRIDAGTVLGLLGPNGAGKSTLLGCLLGLTQPTAGRVQFRGAALAGADRRRFGYLPERVALYPRATVWENGRFFARLRRQPEAELERQLVRVGLAEARHRLVRQLSKGMLQRLGLAVALCGQPEVLVLDEPFNGLDPVWLESLQGILREESARGATLLIATHTLSAVEPLATHLAVLLAGRLVASGAVAGLRAAYAGAPSLEALYHRIARQPVAHGAAAVAA